MTPLYRVQEGTQVKIIKIDAGQGLCGRLKHMGLFEGEQVKVLHNIKGPLIIAKGQMRFALGRGMSHKIFVEEI